MRSSPAKIRHAISKINKAGVLLVFPINNRPEPHSLWGELFPRSKMRWEWSDNGDDRVAQMWQLMKSLSGLHDVVYSKWYQGRATFFSRELFTALLALNLKLNRLNLSPTAELILETLQLNSPISTKKLKSETQLQGKLNASLYNRSLKELFLSLKIVGFGEVDDGAFPSLALGSTQLIHEDLWNEAANLDEANAWLKVDPLMPKGSHFRKHFEKQLGVL